MQALGLIETKGLIAAIESADAMLKAADVNLLEKTYVGAGLVSIAVTGDVGAVKAAVEAGAAAVTMINNTLLVSQHVIPRPHEDLENLIVSAAPLKDIDMSVSVLEKIESEQEVAVEVEEKTSEISAEVPETIVEDLVVEDSESDEVQIKKALGSLKIDLNNVHKEEIDNMVSEYGLEKTIEVLSKLKVVKLRNLARKYKNFGITGRAISKAGKKLLITNFREYYRHN